MHLVIPSNLLYIYDNDDLNSDYSPLITNFDNTLRLSAKYYVINRKSDIKSFMNSIDNNLQVNLTLQSYSEIDDKVKDFTKSIQRAGFISFLTNVAALYYNNYVSLKIWQ